MISETIRSALKHLNPQMMEELQSKGELDDWVAEQEEYVFHVMGSAESRAIRLNFDQPVMRQIQEMNMASKMAEEIALNEIIELIKFSRRDED